MAGAFQGVSRRSMWPQGHFKRSQEEFHRISGALQRVLGGSRRPEGRFKRSQERFTRLAGGLRDVSQRVTVKFQRILRTVSEVWAFQGGHREFQRVT